MAKRKQNLFNHPHHLWDAVISKIYNSKCDLNFICGLQQTRRMEVEWKSSEWKGNGQNQKAI